MPELPEVETVCRGLSAALTGARIVSAEARRKDLRAPLPEKLAARLKGRKIGNITRRAKYILIELSGGETLVLHLGMSGRIVIHKKPQKPAKHDHLIFAFDNGTHAHFNDPRRFGLCDLIKTADLADHKLMRGLGIEPLGKALTATWLARTFKGRRTAIKLALMDQRLIVGIGNIYASEALYGAGIDPRRNAGSLSKDELARLPGAIRRVLRAAITAGGSSLRDYVRADGELGYFQHRFAVYDREGKPCSGCGCNVKETGGVKRIVQGGRSTFLCPVRQK